MPNQANYDMSIEGFGTAPATNASTGRQTQTAAPRKKAVSQQPDAPRHSNGRRTNPNPIISFFTNKVFTRSLGVLLIACAVLSTVFTLDYLTHGSLDQSLVDNNSIGTIAQMSASTDNPETVRNAGGAFGAWVSNVLLVKGLGIGSFVLVVYMSVLAGALFGLIRCRFWAFSFKCLFTAISTSIIFGLFTYNIETAFHWGGNHGRYVNQWLFYISDAIGAYAVSIVLLSLLTVMYFTQLRSFFLKMSGHLKRQREAMIAAATAGRSTSTELADVPEKPANNSKGGETPQPVAPVMSGTSTSIVPQTHPQPATAEIGFEIDDDINDTTIEIDSDPAAPATPATDGEPVFKIKTAFIGDNPDEPKALDETEQTQDEELPPLDIRDELSHFRFPGTDLLIDRPVKVPVDQTEQNEHKDLIVKTLKDYGIPVSRIEATIGPTVTLFEIVPAEGVRIAQIKKLEDDIALSLAALGIRIIAPIPGKGTVGIEVPNREPQTVSIFSVINSRKFRESKAALPIALGATINNDIFIEDLAKMPHLLVAGATGMGKSVGLNCIIASLLYKKHPGELKFVLIDPKMVEFSLYSRLENHYLAKLPNEEDAIVTEASKALTTLNALCLEMDQRYELLKAAGVRTVVEYNTKYTQRRLNPEKGHKYMPYIVVVVDEFADLIMTAGKEISVSIARIAQKARAVGMHMIIATQRPSTDVITGMIKANFPARIAFRVAAMVDSKTILDRPGANRLIGRGDMLYSQNSKMERVQCAFIDTPEVEAIVDFISNQIGYEHSYYLPEPENDNALAPGAIDLSRRDELFDDCARFTVQNATASTSSLQRRFGIGYNKAGKIMDQMEAAGIVGPADGQKPRAVLIDSVALESLLRSL